MSKETRSHRMRKLYVILGILVLFIVGTFVGFTIGIQPDFPEEIAADNPTTEEASVPSADDHIIVKFKEDIPDTEEKKIEEDTQTKETKTIEPVDVKLLEVPKGSNSHETVAEFRTQYAEKIEYAELDGQMEPLMVPNDPYYQSQWALPKIQAPTGWDISQGENSVTIAVLDTGVKADHPDLKNKLAPGYNVVDNNTNVTDLHGHGTMMMGIAGAQTNNAVGVAGVGINPKIMMVRISNNADGWAYYSDMAEAIIYAADNGARVISISFGGTSPSATVQNAINYAYGKGVFITAAAGNSGSTAFHYPAACDHVVSVGATDSNDVKASWSNYGPWVDVTAPGVSIYSTNDEGGYSYGSGTSPATPHVAGLAALMASENANLTPDQIENYIKQNADDLGSTGRDDIYGYGRINLKNTLTAVTGHSAPVSPTGEISGKVTNAKNLAPIVGAKINVLQNGATKANASSLPDGTYTVTNLPEGYYEMIASASGYSSLLQKNILVQAAKTTENINFALTPIVRLGKISGRVVDYKKRPIKGAIVMLQLVSTPRSDIRKVKKAAKTNSQGRFIFINLPQGHYYLKAVYTGHFGMRTSNVYPGSTTSVTIQLTYRNYWRVVKNWIMKFYNYKRY